MTDNQTVVLLSAALSTLSLLVGWLSGSRERHMDDEVLDACRWHDHVQQALFTARPTPDPDEEGTVAQ